MSEIDTKAILASVIGAAIIGLGNIFWTWAKSHPGSFWSDLLKRSAAAVALTALLLSAVALFLGVHNVHADQTRSLTPQQHRTYVIPGKWDHGLQDEGWTTKLKAKAIRDAHSSETKIRIDFSQYHFNTTPVVMLTTATIRDELLEPNPDDVVALLESSNNSSAVIRLFSMRTGRPANVDRPFWFVIFPIEDVQTP